MNTMKFGILASALCLFTTGCSMESLLESLKDGKPLKIQEGTSYNFSQVALSSSSEKELTLLNASTDTLTDLSATFTYSTLSLTSAPFVFKGGTYPGTGGTCGASLAPAATCKVVILYSPTVAQTDGGSINFTYKQLETSSSASFDFAGTGISTNTAPVATNQTLSTAVDTPLSVTISATDANGDTLTYSVLANPTHGTLSGTAPNLTYTPASGYLGSDSFTFKANDGTTDSNTATISLNVLTATNAPNAPASVNCTTSPLAASTGNTCTLTAATPPDADGDTVTYSNATSTCAAVVVNSTTGAATFTAPARGATCLVKIRAYDGSSYSTVTNSATITGANTAPVATAQSVSALNGATASITLAGTDADGDTLTYTVVANPSNGTLSGAAPNLTYTPTSGYNGSDSFTFRVNDGTVNSATATVSLTVTSALALTLSRTMMLDSQTLTYQVVGGTSPYAINANVGSLSSATSSGTYTPATSSSSQIATFVATDAVVTSVTKTAYIKPHYASLSNGAGHTCGLTTAGQTYCWGYNGAGQLGDGTLASSYLPIATSQSSIVFTSIKAGNNHTCGLTGSGQTYCWGSNGHGQLGDNSTTDRLTPVAVSQGGQTYTSITTGAVHTCGLTSAGQTYCWGSNSYGQLGNNSTTSRLTPFAVSQGGQTYVSITAGYDHTCGLTSAGQTYCWGYNSYGQLGDNSLTQRLTPVAVSQGGQSYTSVSGGSFYTCGLTSAGQAYCWGYNSYGKLGDNSTINRLTPVAVSQGGQSYTSISTGIGHTCGLTSAGQTYCWGYNGNGHLGDNSLTQRLTPVAVSQAGYTYASITAVGNHTCGLTSTGQAYCWGANNFGQLGDKTTTQRLVPTASSHPGTVGLRMENLNLYGNSTYTVNLTPGFAPYTVNVSGSVAAYQWTAGVLSINTSPFCATTTSGSVTITDAAGQTDTLNVSCDSIFMSSTSTSVGQPLTYTIHWAGTLSVTLSTNNSGASIDNNSGSGIYTPGTAASCSGVIDTLTVTDQSGNTGSVNITVTDPSVCAVYGCTDSSAANYDGSATSDDGSCWYYVYGCTDSMANNYNSSANSDDGSCTYGVSGCMDPMANNYNAGATVSDGSCTYGVSGCTDPAASNYNSSATSDDGSCIYPVYGCTDVTAYNFNSLATNDDGSCSYYVYGCTDSMANNYNSSANSDDGSCTYGVSGCTDPTANNYNVLANVNDGSCTYDVYGCMDGSANNYNSAATVNDGSCTYNIPGCTDPGANNYDPSANSDDGSCTY